MKDSVTNQGAADQEFQVIFHTNFGAPILEEGAEVVVAAKQVSPMNDEAAKGISSFNQYAGPTAGYVEQVFLIEPYSDSGGEDACCPAQREWGARSRTQLGHRDVALLDA